MSARFLGIPFFVWGLGCLVVAGIFAIFWPVQQAGGQTSGLRYLILRWAHTGVWVLLGFSCFARLLGERGTGLANALGVLAGVVYVLFIVNLLQST
jgi:hypothetical protein